MNTIICTKKDPFKCLERSHPEIYKICSYIEIYLGTDLRITCFYARLIAEQLVRVIFHLQKIALEADSLREILKTSAAKKAIAPEAIAKIERIARVGNKAAHQLPTPSTQSTLNCLRDLLDVVWWFVYKFYKVKINQTLSSQVFKINCKKDLNTILNPNKIMELIDEFVNLRPRQSTKVIYQGTINNFCNLIYPSVSTESAIQSLLNSEESKIKELLIDYRQLLLETTSLSNSTISLRISVMNSFVYHAFSRGHCSRRVSISTIPRDKSTSIKIDRQEWMKAIDNIDLSTPKGARDYAILQLLINEKLAKQDITKIELTSFTESQLSIATVGSLSSKIVSLSTVTRKSIESWIKLRPQIDNKYLFLGLSNNSGSNNNNLSERSIHRILKNIGEAANLNYCLNTRNISASLKYTMSN